jgi:hypothetical protein
LQANCVLAAPDSFYQLVIKQAKDSEFSENTKLPEL